jgi:hypothetical protein
MGLPSISLSAVQCQVIRKLRIAKAYTVNRLIVQRTREKAAPKSRL